MKKIISLILAFVLASTMVIPAFAAPAASSPDCVTVTIDTTGGKNILCEIFHFIVNIFAKIFNWIMSWFTVSEPPAGEEPQPEYPPEELPSLIAIDPNPDIPNGFPVTGSLDHSATTREVAYELIYDNFKDLPGFNPGSEYTVNETANPKVNKAVNFILENNCGDALVYIGINKVDETGTRVNICPNSLATGAFLEAVLFSIPTVSQIIVLNDDPHAPLSKEQIEFIIKYAVLYTRIRDGELINSSGTLTRKEAYEIFKSIYSDIQKTLTIPDPDKLANIDFVDYLAYKFSGSVASHCFGDEPHIPVTSAEVQFVAELNKLMMYGQIVCYQATE